jgi:hypothetical protein
METKPSETPQPNFTPEYAGIFYRDTRERLENYNKMRRLRLAEPLDKQRAAVDLSREDKIRFELNKLNEMIVADFWNYTVEERKFEKILEDKNDISATNARIFAGSYNFGSKTIIQMREEIKSILKVYLSTRTSGDPIIRALDRHSTIMSSPENLVVQKIGDTTEKEIIAGFDTAIEFIFIIANMIPIVYLKQKGEIITPEKYMEAFKNTLPLFEILARNDIDTHSSANSVIWHEDNFLVREVNGQMAIDLSDTFFTKLEKQIEIDKALPSSTEISTDCPALHAITENKKNVIAEFYIFCQKFIQKFLLPHLDRYNTFLLAGKEKAG